jgi:hypothetical protein
MKNDKLHGLFDLIRTTLFLCSDLVSDAKEIPALSAESGNLERLLSILKDEEAFDLMQLTSLYAALERYRGGIAHMYARCPGNTFFEALSRRLDSLRDMTGACIENYRELAGGDKG